MSKNEIKKDLADRVVTLPPAVLFYPHTHTPNFSVFPFSSRACWSRKEPAAGGVWKIEKHLFFWGGGGALEPERYH